jgi:hypothetical protein
VELHLNLGRLFHHVIVRQHIPALIHDHAGTQAALRLRRGILPPVEKSVEEILHRVVLIVSLALALALALLRPSLPRRRLALKNLCGGNVHDSRLDARNNGRK